MTNTQIETKNFKMRVLCEANLNKTQKNSLPCIRENIIRLVYIHDFSFSSFLKHTFTHHKHRERERERQRSNKICYIYIDSKPTNLNK